MSPWRLLSAVIVVVAAIVGVAAVLDVAAVVVMAAAAIAVLVVIIVGLVAGAFYQHLGVARDARHYPPAGRLIDIGERRLHLCCRSDGQDHGDGDAPASVVFDSGLAASSLSWRSVQEAIAPWARTCAYDRAGYGWSDRAPGPRHGAAAAADLRRLLRAAGVPPPYVLVAHSFGAYVALRFAADTPADVGGLVFVDPLLVDEWLTPTAAQRRLVIGGQLFSCIGAALAAVGVVRFLLHRFSTGSGHRGRSHIGNHAAGHTASHVGSHSDTGSGTGASLPATVLRLFGPAADAAVRRVVGEVTKLPPALWPTVQAHWSRPRSFLTMAQHFRALAPSAADLHATLAPGGPALASLHEIPIVVISAANCPDDRLQGHRQLAALSRDGTHVHAATGGHWVHLDQPGIVVDAVRSVMVREG